MTRQRLDRRGFLKTAGVAAAGAGLWAMSGRAWAAPAAAGAPHAKELGWKLGCQAWTFNNTTFFDAVEKTASLGLHYIEAYPGQKLSSEKPDAKMGEGLSEADRKAVKKHLADNGVTLTSFGVGGYSKAIFEFAKDMGMATIVSEPPPGAFDEIDKLCEEFQINLALHNHPKGSSRYWDPALVLKACEGHSKRIGACCDVGHWLTSGIDPLEALKKLEGRIIEFHLKDRNKKGPGGHDVPWGTGVADIKGLLEEVKRQGIKPFFAIEYEYDVGHSLPECAECVAYFDKVCAQLTGT